MTSTATNRPLAHLELPGAASGTRATVDYGRLELVAWILAGLAAVPLFAWPLVAWRSGGVWAQDSWHYARVAALVLLSVGVAIACRKKAFPSRRFSQIALAYEVFTTLGITAAIVGWQWTVHTDATTMLWAEQGGRQPWELGGTLPWAGVWVLVFATLVPMHPVYHLAGGLFAAVAIALWTLVSPALQGFPAELVSVQTALSVKVASVVGVQTAIAAMMAYAAARYVYGMRREISRARRMGSYTLQRKLGEGGMGEVWLGKHQMLARTAAIKLIKTDRDGSVLAETTIKRFQKEVAAAVLLKSHRTVEVYDYGIADDGSFYYVMEHLDGKDLLDVVRASGPMPWQRVVYILKQVCHSLGEAHHLGLVHRDIKPANVFLCRQGRDLDQVKVLDFGIVKDLGAGDGDVNLTAAGHFVGTPAYAAPELVTGMADGVDARTDIYSIGCMAWFLLTGRLVFEANTEIEMIFKLGHATPDPPSQHARHSVPGALDEIVLACLEKDPDDRIESVDVLAKRLGALDDIDRWTVDSASAWWEQYGPPLDSGESMAAHDPD